MRPGQARGQRSHRCATIAQQASTKRRLASPTSSSGRPHLATSSSTQPRANIGRPSCNERGATSTAEARDKRGRSTTELQARRRCTKRARPVPQSTAQQFARAVASRRDIARACARHRARIQLWHKVLIRSENLGSDTTVGIRIAPPGEAAEEQINMCRETINTMNNSKIYDIHRVFQKNTLLALEHGSNRNYKNAGSSRPASGGGGEGGDGGLRTAAAAAGDARRRREEDEERGQASV
ncbi:hypothetical protein F511_21309 [Dorcoceras hygrometricum]|uniref:Uncharacterized protein n=1 Tax=Dorcoceras hygrometricum TaxID=472368 RepID=A0A2Z7B858_9LAMI|nr:hypothetical protein F511_21309 [Dorcoceras hygrometricum]